MHGPTFGVQFDWDGSLALAADLWVLAEQVQQIGVQLDDPFRALASTWLGPRGDAFVQVGVAAADDLDGVVVRLRAEALGWADGYRRAAQEVHQRRYEHAVQLAQSAATEDEPPAYVPPPPTVSRPSPPSFAPTA